MTKSAESRISVAHVDPTYASGSYFREPSRYGDDAPFKAACFLRLFRRVVRELNAVSLQSYADVGCGSGAAAQLVVRSLRADGHALTAALAYDVSPHVARMHSDHVKFVHGDFRDFGGTVDLVTMFDVFEHIVDPIEFIKQVAQRCSMIGFHIPLDRSLNNALRNKYRALLRSPGHVVFMDVADALNFLALAGLRTLEYEYTFPFRAPSGHRSLMSKLAFPVKSVIGGLSPWLLSKTIGGASLVVIALTPAGLEKYGYVAQSHG